MARCLLYLSLICCANPIVRAQADQRITQYRAIFAVVYDKNNQQSMAIRSYYQGSKRYFLLVNPYNFSTRIAPAGRFSRREVAVSIETIVSNRAFRHTLATTPYIRALQRYTRPPYGLQNYGLTRAAQPTTGLFLTIDLCPAKKEFEAHFFNQLMQRYPPLPVAIAITGRWIEGHPKSFNWLLQQAAAKTLRPTWINHSFTHPYHPGLPLEKNFLLSTGTQIDEEILATEQLLLANKQLPSPFFRFPGLVSNQALIEKLRQFGLIPIGSSAWLAKGEPATPGAIILVHGNANEPAGIHKLLPLLAREDLQWLPLTHAF